MHIDKMDISCVITKLASYKPLRQNLQRRSFLDESHYIQIRDASESVLTQRIGPLNLVDL